MSDKISVDDILAELDLRKGIVRPPKPKPDDTFVVETKKSKSFSLTEELAMIERRRGIIPPPEQKQEIGEEPVKPIKPIKPIEPINELMNESDNETVKEYVAGRRGEQAGKHTEKSVSIRGAVREPVKKPPETEKFKPAQTAQPTGIEKDSERQAAEKNVKKSEYVKTTPYRNKNRETLSVTTILDDNRLKNPRSAEKSKMGVTQILDSEEMQRRSKGAKYTSPQKSDKSERVEHIEHIGYNGKTDNKVKNEKNKMGVTQILDSTEMKKRSKGYASPPKSEKNERVDYKLKSEKIKKADVFYEKARVLPKPLIEEPGFEPAVPKKKRNLNILEHDMALENPHELIDGLNPYDIIKNAESTAKDEEIAFNLSGDTQGIAGNDLKELAARSADEAASAFTTAEVGVKKYTPPENKPEDATRQIPVVEKAKRSNTALLESLNKAIREKREKDIAAQRTLNSINTRQESRSKTKLPTNALNIDYKKQILMDTTSVPISGDHVIAEQKINELEMKRKRKIRDFVLEDIDSDEEHDPTYYDSEEEKSDYDNYDSSGQIWSDLCESHKSIKVRFLILLIITGIAVFLTVMNDFLLNSLQTSLAFNILGTDILFFDKRFDPAGYLYLTLILGVVGFATCGTVITGGISRLFSGKGDCDSICAVPAVISLICVIPHLENTDFIQRSRAGVFVAAGLAALLFNTLGKLIMIVRAKRNFRFISGDKTKYYAEILSDQELARSFTKGILNIPVLAVMRKTEFLTDFLKNSYCTDTSDKISRLLTPIGFGVSVLFGLLAFVIPTESADFGGNLYWALTVGCGMITALSPFSMMFIVNLPLGRAVKSLEKNDSVIMGYESAAEFSKVNSVLVDASLLFPAGSVAFRNIKRCQQSSSLNAYAIDEAIITAASLAITSGSILTYMFYDMIAGRSELLYKVDNCIYEVNMGISGWIGNKRIMLGNRDQMKHHGIKVPDIKKERKYCSENGDVVYLAAGGETVSMFFIEIIPNAEIYRAMQELTENGISVVVKTKDSLITINKLADVFDIPPESLRVLPFDMHEMFDDCTKYTSRGNSAIACNGTFTSFAESIVAAKKIIRDTGVFSWMTYIGLFSAGVLGMLFMLFTRPQMFTSTNVILYNTALTVIMAVIQRIRRYG